MSPSIDRRAFLLGSAAGLSALAGCSALDGGGEDPGPVRLGVIQLDNDDANPHTLHLLVERDGELVGWESPRLAGREGTGTDSVQLEEFRCQRGRYRLRARVDDAGEWETFEPTSDAGAFFTVREDATLGYGYVYGDRFECTEQSPE